MRMDEVERAELTGIDVEHVRDEEGRTVAKTRPGVVDVPLADVEPYILDVRQVIHDVTGTASDVEHAIAGARSKMVDDDRALEGPGTYDALIGPKDRRH